MEILVLDAIHGGRAIAAALQARGHRADVVDVYRDETVLTVRGALSRAYDLVVSPVHLTPGHPLLRSRSIPCISHHDAVRWVLGDQVPAPFIEITGAQGKTTTAHALAHLMPGPGILHTSSGTVQLPEGRLLWKKSIAPASVIDAARHADRIGGWCIAEVSLGFTGAGNLGILTSPLDYPVAGGMKRALDEKVRSAAHCRKLITAPGVEVPYPWSCPVNGMTGCGAESCSGDAGGLAWAFESPLLAFESYRVPLMLAAAAATFLGQDPGGLATFEPPAGRMAIARDGAVLIIDNANSGTNVDTTVEAVTAARNMAGDRKMTLVIGMDAHAVCEGFPPHEIARAIRLTRPDRIVLVGEINPDPAVESAREIGIPLAYAADLEEGRQIACEGKNPGTVVLAVKTWR